MTKDELYEEMRIDAYNERRQDEEEARLDWKLKCDYDFFAKHFHEEFTMAIDAIKELKRLHNVYNHTLEAEDLL